LASQLQTFKAEKELKNSHVLHGLDCGVVEVGVHASVIVKSSVMLGVLLVG